MADLSARRPWTLKRPSKCPSMGKGGAPESAALTMRGTSTVEVAAMGMARASSLAFCTSSSRLSPWALAQMGASAGSVVAANSCSMAAGSRCCHLWGQ